MQSGGRSDEFGFNGSVHGVLPPWSDDETTTAWSPSDWQDMEQERASTQAIDVRPASAARGDEPVWLDTSSGWDNAPLILSIEDATGPAPQRNAPATQRFNPGAAPLPVPRKRHPTICGIPAAALQRQPLPAAALARSQRATPVSGRPRSSPPQMGMVGHGQPAPHSSAQLGRTWIGHEPAQAGLARAALATGAGAQGRAGVGRTLIGVGASPAARASSMPVARAQPAAAAARAAAHPGAAPAHAPAAIARGVPQRGQPHAPARPQQQPARAAAPNLAQRAPLAPAPQLNLPALDVDSLPRERPSTLRTSIWYALAAALGLGAAELFARSVMPQTTAVPLAPMAAPALPAAPPPAPELPPPPAADPAAALPSVRPPAAEHSRKAGRSAKSSWRERHARSSYGSSRSSARSASRERVASSSGDSLVRETRPQPTAASEPEPVAAPASESQQPATLRINSRPWAQVFVDGRLVGNTPQQSLRVSAGSHEIRLLNPEFGMSKTFSVTLSPGESVTRIENLGE